jgi:hypothetical protein
MALLSITILPLLGFMAMAPSLHVKRERDIRSAFLAQLMAEQIKHDGMADFDGPDLDGDGDGDGYNISGDFSDYPAQLPEAERLGSDYQNFRYTVTDSFDPVSYDPDDPTMQIRPITIEVGYDVDGSSTLDSNEVLVTVNVKVARRN